MKTIGYALFLCSTVLIGFGMTGCGSTGRVGPYTTPTESARDQLKAQRLTLQAVELAVEDPERAEELLREALTADMFHGPAHNDLGVMFLKKGKLYEAANEFEWARKLMPGHPDPRMNLALTLEKAGRIDEALVTYDTALEAYPNHLPTVQGLARCQLRYGRADGRTRGFLEQIALQSGSERWRDWARMQMTRASVGH